MNFHTIYDHIPSLKGNTQGIFLSVEHISVEDDGFLVVVPIVVVASVVDVVNVVGDGEFVLVVSVIVMVFDVVVVFIVAVVLVVVVTGIVVKIVVISSFSIVTAGPNSVISHFILEQPSCFINVPIGYLLPMTRQHNGVILVSMNVCCPSTEQT